MSKMAPTDDTTTDRPTVEIVEEYENQYGDQRLRLDTPYEARDAMNGLEWHDAHQDYDPDSQTWLVDADALELVTEALDEAGFDLVDRRGEEPDDDHGPLLALAEEAGTREGDRIEVHYVQKNGEATNSKAGVITGAALPGDRRGREEPVIRFQRDDGQRMSVRPDQHGESSLFTSGSHAPYVGAVTDVTFGDGE